MVRNCRVVPKEWTRFPALGDVIPNTRFIVFKTPLNERLSSRIPKHQRFMPPDLVRMLAMRGQRLGVIVDLTDTDRYYDRFDFEGLGIPVEKIYCGGRGFVDRTELAEKFGRVVAKFIDSHKDDAEALIGVHCTRGVNRSGFLVCRFLIENLGWSSHQAIDAFENARGCPIEKGAYVRALHAVAREARNRRDRGDSDGESSRASRRKKEKRDKRKNTSSKRKVGGEDTGDATPSEFPGAAAKMFTQFFGVMEQHNKQLEASSQSPQLWRVQQTDSQAQSESSSPHVHGEDYDDEEEEEEIEYPDTFDDTKARSTAAKRRQRKRRTQHKFEVMKRGRFHEIQEMREQMGP